MGPVFWAVRIRVMAMTKATRANVTLITFIVSKVEGSMEEEFLRLSVKKKRKNFFVLVILGLIGRSKRKLRLVIIGEWGG